MDISKLTLHESSQSQSSKPLKIGVEGCGHGELNNIYSSLERSCKSRGWTIAELDFLIICGDFQAVRNEHDLNCMAIPRKYREMADFHQYYSGEKCAPVLTLVIGGNHEASNYLSELHYGGWLAPNIYYLGAVGVVRYGPLRIAGMSGIYDSGDYNKPHHESLPYNRSEMRSVYHVRECDVAKLLQIRSPIDICISHDWPRRIEWFGDYEKLFAARPPFFESAKIDNLGSAPAEKVLNHLRPRHWFSGHMHIKFSALVEHRDGGSVDVLETMNVPQEIRSQLTRSMFKAPLPKKQQAPKSASSKTSNTVTKFLALDKPGINREYLEVVEIEPDLNVEGHSKDPVMEKTADGHFALHYDEEWLSILHSSSNKQNPDDFTNKRAIDDISDCLDWVRTNITEKGFLKVPQNFKQHAPVYDPAIKVGPKDQPKAYPNSQTKTFCALVGIKDKFSGMEQEGNDGNDSGDDFIVFG